MIKLFFDECCSARLPKMLKEFYQEDYPDLITAHLADYVKRGSPDHEWIRLLSSERGWIVISADRGAGPNKDKLPLICTQLSVTCILFTAGLHNRGYAAHKQALTTVWPQIVRASALERGTRISLGMRSQKAKGELASLTINGKAFDSVCPPS